MSNNIAPWVSKIAVFDTETTGINVREDRIVSATVALLDAGSVKARYDWVINPGIEIPQQATNVHGITNEVARLSGIEAKTGVQQIVMRLREALESGYNLVAFNASYDFSLLTAEADRHGIALPEIKPVLDPYILDRYLDRYRKGRRTLEAVCIHYGVDLLNAHDAGADALAAGAVLYKIAEKYANSLSPDVFQMHAAQVAWEYELTMNYKQYLHRNGKPHESVVPGWPVRS